MILPYLITAQAARVNSTDFWRIEHAATHLYIEILLPDTDPPAVKWILPDGSMVEGSVLDADVPAGETKCVCGDFTRCGIDMSGCDPYAVRINCSEIPTVRHRLIGMRGRCGYLRDMQFNKVYKVAAPGSTIADKAMFGLGHFVLKGCEHLPSELVFTVDDINKSKADTTHNQTHTHIEIAYAPYFTGDLSKLNVKTQHFYRKVNADFTHYEKIEGTADNMIYLVPKTIIHHCGVYGHPDFTYASPAYVGFYGNPYMTPDDYDQTVISYEKRIKELSDANCLFVFSSIDPASFVLDISSRRTSASDEAVASLRSMGMTVNEIED